MAWNTLDGRAKLGISQTELAERSGLSRRSIQYLEDVNSQFSPSLDVLEKVAKALKLEVIDLFNPVDLTKPAYRAANVRVEREMLKDLEDLKLGKVKAIRVKRDSGVYANVEGASGLVRETKRRYRISGRPNPASMKRFKRLLARVQKRVRKAGLTPADVESAIARVQRAK